MNTFAGDYIKLSDLRLESKSVYQCFHVSRCRDQLQTKGVMEELLRSISTTILCLVQKAIAPSNRLASAVLQDFTGGQGAVMICCFLLLG